MALNNISVKVCGNPDSNSGFVPLLLFNSPSFAVEDQFYVGFDNCSYFFSMKVETTQTVYKLIKNNVKSYGASRAGSLVISFSIPKGYKLEGGYTPYDVLTQLKEEFLKRCMTCKDPSKESYEYKPGRVDQHILDEKIKKFTIAPANMPHRVMNPSGSIGYIVRPESDIEKFFHDTKYPELQLYKELIVAESVNNSNYTPITNIQIPRPIVYTLVVDGIQKGQGYSDIDAPIVIASGNMGDPYYNHKTVKFSIRDLLDKNVLPVEGIEIDSIEEKIIVNTTTWVKPKVRKFFVRIIPGDYENDILITSNLLQISKPDGVIKLQDDFSFTLTGQQISYIASQQIKVSIKQNEKYLYEKAVFSNDELRVTVKKKQKITGEQGRVIGGQRDISHPPIMSSPVIDIKLVLPNFKIFKDSRRLPINVLSRSERPNSEEIRSTTKVDFVETNNQYVGHLYIPTDYQEHNYYIGFETPNNRYFSSKSINFNQKGNELCIDSFDKQPKSLFDRIPFIVVACTVLLLTFLIGSVTGHIAHDSLNRMFITKDSIPANQEDDPQTSSVIGNNRISKDDAVSFLTNVRDGFKSRKDISFDEIDEYFNYYVENEYVVSTVDKESFDSKICNQIKDYHSLKDAIVTGDIVKLKDYIEYYKKNEFYILSQHAEIITSLLEKEDNINSFMTDDYASVKSFVDLMKYINNTPAHTSTPTPTPTPEFKCDKCNYEARNSNDLQNHKRRNHPDRFTCTICPGGNTWFRTNDELEAHMKTKHNVER